MRHRPKYEAEAGRQAAIERQHAVRELRRTRRASVPRQRGFSPIARQDAGTKTEMRRSEKG
jgi:hypothetical protein